MGQITQIAFELRNLTQAALDEEDSDGDLEESQITWEMRAQKEELGRWLKFCKSKIDKIEKVWKRKLDETTGDEDSSQNSSEDNDFSHEDTIERLLAQDTSNRLSRSHVETRRDDLTSQDLKAASENA